MLGLKVAVVAMGVLIVAGVGVVVVTLVNRMQAPAVLGGTAGLSSIVLDEPEGTHITGVSLGVDRMAVQLQGGGPDRVAVVDMRGGRVLGHVGLAR